MLRRPDRRPNTARSRRLARPAAALLAVAALLAAVGVVGPAQGRATVDLKGKWICCGGGGAAAQEFVLSGAVSGSANLPGGQVFAKITGSASGKKVTIVTTYNEFSPGYVATFVGTLSADGGTITGSWTSNRGQAGTFTATRERPKRELSGRVTALKCGLNSCQRVPVKKVRVTATSDASGSGSATTDNAGRYTISGLKAGHFRVSADRSYTSDPVSRAVSLVDSDADGVDFTVCKEDDPNNPSLKCLPRFDWTMPERLGKTGEPTGKEASDFQPKSYPLTFTILGGACDRKATYTWTVDDEEKKAKEIGGPCKVEILFPDEGTYKVRVEQSKGSAPKKPYLTEVVVQDFVIASIGDSLASGEGNKPYTDGSLSLCHRSKSAYGPVAAARIEDADPHSSVTYLHLACTGGSMSGGILEQNLGHQLRRLKNLVGDRRIDALTISVGINDIGFATLLWRCWRDHSCHTKPFGENDPVLEAIAKAVKKPLPPQPTLDQVTASLFAALPDHYSKLGLEIKKLFPTSQLKSDHIYLVGYPDPLHDEQGKLCDVVIANKSGSAGTSMVSVAIGKGVTGLGFRNDNKEGEVTWASRRVVEPLNAALQRRAANWTYVPAPGSVFDRHGACSKSSWWVDVPDAFSTTKGPTSILHPAETSHRALADELLGRLEHDLLPGGSPRKP